MISEIENLQKGIVVSTVEYDTNKRIIGIGTPTITPDQVTGISPLSKQTGFIKEEPANLAQAAEKVLGVEQSMGVPIEEPIPQVQPQMQTINDNMNSVQPQTFAETVTPAMNPLPVPEVGELVSTNPVQVEISPELNSVPGGNSFVKPLNEVVAPIAEPILDALNRQAIQPEVVPQLEPVEEPVVRETVLATEPVGINDEMFAPLNTTQLENPVAMDNLNVEQVGSPEQSLNSVPVYPETQMENFTENIGKVENVLEKTILTVEQKEQIAKKISDIVYREVLGLLNEIENKMEQNKESIADMNTQPAVSAFEGNMIQENKPMSMTL